MGGCREPWNEPVHPHPVPGWVSSGVLNSYISRTEKHNEAIAPPPLLESLPTPQGCLLQSQLSIIWFVEVFFSRAQGVWGE